VLEVTLLNIKRSVKRRESLMKNRIFHRATMNTRKKLLVYAVI